MSETILTPLDEELLQAASVVEVEESPEVPEADFEHAFADHVSYVRSKPDMLERIKGWTSWPRIGRIALIEFGAIEVNTTLEHSSEAYLLPPLVVGSLAAVGTYTIGRLAYRRYVQEKLYNNEAQQQVGERYELYKAHTHDADALQPIIMRWYGPHAKTADPERTPAQSLEMLAELADQNSISAVCIDEVVLDKLPLPDKNYGGTEVGPESVWLKRTARLKKSLNEDLSLKSFSSAELRILADRCEQQEITADLLKKIIGLLKEAQEDHPLVKLYEEFKDDDKLLYRRLAPASRTALERQLDTSQQARISVAPGVAVKQKLDSAGLVSGQAVNRYNPKQFTSQSLQTALGIRDEQLKALEDAPEALTKRQLSLLAEYAVYQITHNYDVDLHFTEAPPNVAADASNGLQMELLRNAGFGIIDTGRASGHYSNRMPSGFRSATLRMAAAILVAGLGSAGATKLYEQEVSAVLKSANVMTVDDLSKHHVSPNASQDVKEFSSLFAAEGKFYHIFYRPPKKDSGDGSKDAGSASSPGDPNTIEWNVVDHGLTMPEYWAEHTYDALDNGGWAFYSQATIMEAVPTTPQFHYGKHNIELSQQFSNAELQDVDGELRVPIGDGRGIVAASYNNEPVKVIQYADGTSSLKIPLTELKTHPHKSHNLVYWLGSTATVVHAMMPTNITVQQSSTNHIWDTYLQKPMSAHPTLREEVTAVKNNFEYSIYPQNAWDGDQLLVPHLLMNRLLDNHLQADCKVANTLVAANQPSVNAVTGYYHNFNGKNSGVLTSHQRHLWLTTQSGIKYDATPSKGADKYDAYFNEVPKPKKLDHEKFHFTHKEKEDALIALGGISLLAAAYARRKRLARIPGSAAAWTGRLYLKNSGRYSLAFALEASQQSRFSEERTNPHKRAMNARSQGYLINRLLRPEVNEALSRNLVKQKMAGQKGNRRARAVLKAADWASRRPIRYNK